MQNCNQICKSGTEAMDPDFCNLKSDLDPYRVGYTDPDPGDKSLEKVGTCTWN